MIWLFVFCTILALAAVAAVLVRRSLEREFSDLTCHLCEIKRAVSGTPDVPRTVPVPRTNGHDVPRTAPVQPDVPRTDPAQPNPARASVPVRNVAHER